MKIAVSSSDELIRLDLFLSQRLVQFSRTNIQKMISNQSIKVNGEWTKKNSALNYGDIIEIDLTNKDNLEET
ncbi:MAG: S4 domain-containing protein, partial [Candidatus Neomarinimicrobiota bacterium]|nr:S4 domain-containing protein [Candidatus Neomarinimicrobiota bacterium]